MSWSQITFAGVGGLLFACAIIVVARRGNLSMRYTLGWLFISACIALSGLLGGVVRTIADVFDVEPLFLVIALAAAGLLAITVQLSITVSGLTERVRTLAESCALLEEELERSVSRSTSDGGNADDSPAS